MIMKIRWMPAFLALILCLCCFPCLHTEAEEGYTLTSPAIETLRSWGFTLDDATLNKAETQLVPDVDINMLCGGIGFGSGTSYYGIFYSDSDDLLAVNVSLGSLEELQHQGPGFISVPPFSESNKRYYVEPLGNHFFYYEAHY